MYSNPEGIYDLLKIEEMGANLVIVSSGVWGVAGWDIMRIRERCGTSPRPYGTVRDFLFPVRGAAGYPENLAAVLRDEDTMERV